MEIAIEPWTKLIIHELLEQRFDDWMRQISYAARSAGGAIPTMLWAKGIIFAATNFPDTETIVQEKLKGILHYSSITFAIKEKFEREIVKEGGTVNFIDVSHNEIFGKMADLLKGQSKFKSA